jgi:hypothetical protein
MAASEFGARIGRIRMKNGGADVRVLDRQPINLDGDDWRGTIVRAARQIAALGTDDQQLVGYFIAGVFSDGTTSTGFRYDPVKCVIPRALFPAWVAEIIRRDLITETEARDVFNEMFEWQEGPTG